MAIYDCKFVYVKGEDNTVANSLSRYPFPTVMECAEVEKTSHHPCEVVQGCIALVVVLARVELLLDSVAALSSAPKLENIKQIVIDDTLVKEMWEAYAKDPWCKQLLSAAQGMPEICIKDGLWFIGNQLVVPGGCSAREDIFCIAHNALGHFGFYKTYGLLCGSYFWPNM